MNDRPTATHEIADDTTEADRTQAARLLRAISADPLSVGELVLAALVEHRVAASARAFAEGTATMLDKLGGTPVTADVWGELERHAARENVKRAQR